MKPYDKQRIRSKIGKTLAKPLSSLVANSMTDDFARLMEAYWCILLGKGAGTRWTLDVEAKATKSLIDTYAPTLFDVGANMGEWALLLHKYFPQGRTFLFEPNSVCQQVIRHKEIPNSVLIPQAVSSSKHPVEFYATRDGAGASSLHQRRDSYFQDRDFVRVEVDTTTIDDVVSNYNIGCVDFMKLDIEGHELEALKGAAGSLEGRVIRALSFEFGSANINSRTFFHDFWDLLHPLGYQIYRILPSSRLMHIREYYEDCEYFRSATNYIAVLQ